MNNYFNFRNILNYSRIISREYAFKSELKIKWVRPEKVSCILPAKSGDQSGVPKIDEKQILPEFRGSNELEDANEMVKSLYQLENNRSKYSAEVYREMLVREVQRHSLDFKSMESKLAQMTGRIRTLQSILEKYPRNKRQKVVCKELIEKRKKFLKYLRRWDYKRFEWILEKLDLIYKPPPTEFHWITRKESLKKLAIAHCENLKQDRLDAYRKILEGQQIDFLEKKLKNLEFIRKEQQECQVKVTVSEDDIKDVRKKLEELKVKRNVVEEKSN